MDPELALLAGTAGTTIATLLATDTWSGTRNGMLSLWRRVRPDHERDVSTQLDASRRELLNARSVGDQGTEGEVAAEWRGRIRRLLAAHPEVADDLRVLLAELASNVPAAPNVSQSATASGGSRVYQAGRDLNIDQR